MPQLNPSPWFFILLLSWTMMLMVFKTKIMFSTTTNTPSTPDLLALHTTPWNWPWT